ncbi:hypothetical protein AC629_34995 [Bradyrhizobium sp. NAS80.1]|nr:hypothetical protein AC629_34995 [Bradyrhizobium sp. NAS80.1]
MDPQEFERNTEALARELTLEDVDDELCRLPASPDTDRDLIARAVMMRRRLELIDASRPNPMAPPPDPDGMVEANLPEGAATCVQDRMLRGKYFYAEDRGGRLVIRLPWRTFYDLANSIHVSGSGPNGAAWWLANPHLSDRLPKNGPPPLPEPPR